MANYQTQIFKNRKTAIKFATWIDKEIGVYFEINEVDIYNNNDYQGTGYQIIVFDLTSKEVEKIRNFEKKYKG